MLGWLRNVLGVSRASFPGANPDPSPSALPPLSVPDRGLGLFSRARRIDDSPGALIQELARRDKGYSTIKLVAHPTRTTPTSATFRLGGPDGLRLRPGEQLLLELPKELAKRPVYQAVLEHRQVLQEKSSVPSGQKKNWDETPGVTALHFHSTSPGWSDPWRYWNAPWGSSGEQGGKYAEIRPDWESESHFDLAKNGTTPVGGGKKRHQLLHADAVRVRGLGVDPTFVRSVTITFAPKPADEHDELVFTQGTSIGDLLTADGQVFGKNFKKGTYPGALALLDGAGGGEGLATLAKARPDWKLEAGRLTIPLEPGRCFLGVELACGDTKPDGKLNSDGEVGTQGHSRLRLGIQKAGSENPAWFVDDHGVPPKGVIFGGPLAEHVVSPGDRLVVSAEVDPTYLMAVRLSYSKT